MDEYTTVQISLKTLNLLKTHKLHPKESYADVMDRLIAIHKEKRR